MCGVQTYYISPPNDQESQMLIFVNIDSEVYRDKTHLFKKVMRKPKPMKIIT